MRTAPFPRHTALEHFLPARPWPDKLDEFGKVEEEMLIDGWLKVRMESGESGAVGDEGGLDGSCLFWTDSTTSNEVDPADEVEKRF